MVRALVIGVAVLAATACRDPGLAELEAVKAEVCACKTAACGETALKKVPQHDVESNHRSQRIAREMLTCMADIYAADTPTTDPDAEQPAADPAGGTAAPAP
ncbi:MAG: hypothetical protein M3680_33315 [Myxococcota bacterium]|nr:hypothetical protein [Myxococcota bacterium]